MRLVKRGNTIEPEEGLLFKYLETPRLNAVAAEDGLIRTYVVKPRGFPCPLRRPLRCILSIHSEDAIRRVGHGLATWSGCQVDRSGQERIGADKPRSQLRDAAPIGGNGPMYAMQRSMLTIMRLRAWLFPHETYARTHAIESLPSPAFRARSRSRARACARCRYRHRHHPPTTPLPLPAVLPGFLVDDAGRQSPTSLPQLQVRQPESRADAGGRRKLIRSKNRRLKRRCTRELPCCSLVMLSFLRAVRDANQLFATGLVRPTGQAMQLSSWGLPAWVWD